MDFTKYLVSVPEGRSGNFAVERFQISKSEAESFNAKQRHDARWSGRRYRPVRPGGYTRLVEYVNGRQGNPEVWMSDTPAECLEHVEPINRAHGRCLVNGLGLGLVVGAMLANDQVERVTVIEISTDIFNLVAPHYRQVYGNRFECLLADTYEWKPPRGVRYQVVWHDIWPCIDADNLEGMTKLHRKYGRRADWQGSWLRCECENMRDQQRRETNAWGLLARRLAVKT